MTLDQVWEIALLLLLCPVTSILSKDGFFSSFHQRQVGCTDFIFSVFSFQHGIGYIVGPLLVTLCRAGFITFQNDLCSLEPIV